MIMSMNMSMTIYNVVRIEYQTLFVAQSNASFDICTFCVEMCQRPNGKTYIQTYKYDFFWQRKHSSTATIYYTKSKSES